MRRLTGALQVLVMLLVAAVAIAGCGDGNGGRADGNGSPPGLDGPALLFFTADG